jgi:putative NADH-flavin reductase
MYKIAVLGGTGKAGTFVVDELIRQGYPIKVLARNPEKVIQNSTLIEVVSGSARSFATIQRLVNGCQAVISTLGPAKDEAGVNSMAVDHLVRVMRNLKIKRYIEVAGWGINTPDDHKGFKIRLVGWLIRKFSPKSANDRQIAYEMLRSSNLDWTIVRCPIIELTKAHRKLIVNPGNSPGNKVSSADLAEFLVSQLKSNEYIRKCPFIAS